MKWAVIGWVSSTNNGCFSISDDEFSAHKSKREFCKNFGVNSFYVVDLAGYDNLSTAVQVVLEARGFNLNQSITGDIYDQHFEFLCDVRESSDRLTALPGDAGYSRYLKTLDDIIDSGLMDLVEEMDDGFPLMLPENLVVDLRGDLYFRRNYLKLRGVI